MANQQLIKGAGRAANKFTDVGRVVGEAVAEGEKAFLRRKIERKAEEEKIEKQEKERQNLQARAIAGLKEFDQSKLMPQIRPAFVKSAFELKKGAMAVISNKDLDPVTAQLEVQKYLQGVNDLATKANDFKEWYKQFADTTQDDLSKLNNSMLREHANDIMKGNFKFEGGMFILEGEDPMTFDDLMKIQLINKRSDSYLTLLETAKSAALEAGAKGGDRDLYMTALNDKFDASRFDDASIASILVDELGYNADDNEIRKQIKRDFENDGKFDDPGVREKYLSIIKEKITDGAMERFNKGKEVYDKKLATTPSKVDKDEELVMQGSKEATKLLNNPSEYFRSVSGDKTKFNEVTREFSLAAYDDDGNESFIAYDLLNENDITRLFNQIQTNKSYTAAVRKKLEEGLRTLIASPQFAEYQKQGEAGRRPTTKPIDTGNLPIGFTNRE
jgi:hypothetical protein